MSNPVGTDVDLPSPKRPEEKRESKKESIQKKSFTVWINNVLSSGAAEQSQAFAKVTDVKADFSDGVKLIQLLEILAGQKFTYSKDPKSEEEKIENLTTFLEYMKEVELKSETASAISANDIYEGKLQPILEIIWSLIRHFQICGHDIDTHLLPWVNALMPEQNVRNFTTDWNDGVAVCALVDHIQPGTCPDYCHFNSQDKHNNCITGVRIAEQKLKVERIVDPKDLCHPDIGERSVATYISSFCKCANTLALKWVQELLPERKIVNLDADWSDGVNLAILVDALMPGSFPNCQKLSPDSAHNNLTEAMKVCESSLGVKPHPTLSEGKVDEISTATYLFQLKHAKSISDNVACKGVGLSKAFLGDSASFEVDMTKIKTEHPVKDLEVTISVEENSLIEPKIVHDRKGCFHVKYTAWSTKKLEIKIRWKNIVIHPNPFKVDVIDFNNISFAAKDRFIKVGNPIVAEVKGVNDWFEDLEVSLLEANEGKVIKTDSIEKKDSEKVEYSFTDAQVGKYKLVAKLYEKTVPGSLKEIEIVDPKLYSVKIQEPGKTQESSSIKVNHPAVFTVDTSGADYGCLEASLKTPGAAEPKVVTLIEQKGAIVGKFAPTESGNYEVIITCAGEHINGSPIQFSICDPCRCIFEDELPQYVRVGVSHAVKLSTKGAGPGKLDVSSSQVDILTVNSEINEDGNGYTIHFSPKMVGESKINVKFDGTSINKDCKISVCDATKCRAFGTVIEEKRAKCNEAFEITVEAKEAGKGGLSAIMTHGQTKKKQAPNKVSDGTYTFLFTSFEAGEHKIHIFFGGTEIQNSPFSVKVSCDAVQFMAEGDGLREATACRAAVFEVKGPQSGLIEEGMLQISVKGAQFESTMVDEEEFNPSSDQALVCATEKQKRSYMIKYSVPDHGNCTVFIDIDNKPIPNSPFNVKVRPAFDPSKCKAFGPLIDNPNGIVLGEHIEFKVDTTHAGTGELTAMATDSSQSEVVVSIDKDNKSYYNQDAYIVSLDTTKVGKHTVDVYWNGEVICKSPFNFEVCDPSKVKVLDLPTPQEYVAEAKKPLTFKVDSKDAGRVDIKSTVKFSSGHEVEVEPIQHKVGEILFEYKPSKVGQMQLSITCNGKSILPSVWECEIVNPVPEAIESEGTKEDINRLKQDKESENMNEESLIEDTDYAGDDKIADLLMESSVDPDPISADEETGQIAAADLQNDKKEKATRDSNYPKPADEDTNQATDDQSSASQVENTVPKVALQEDDVGPTNFSIDGETEVDPVPADEETSQGAATDLQSNQAEGNAKDKLDPKPPDEDTNQDADDQNSASQVENTEPKFALQEDDVGPTNFSIDGETEVDPVPADEETNQGAATDLQSDQADGNAKDKLNPKPPDEDSSQAANSQNSTNQIENTEPVVVLKKSGVGQNDISVDKSFRESEVDPLPAEKETGQPAATDLQNGQTDSNNPKNADEDSSQSPDHKSSASKAKDTVPDLPADKSELTSSPSENITSDMMDSENESDDDFSHRPLNSRQEDSPLDNSPIQLQDEKHKSMFFNVQVGVPFSFNVVVSPPNEDRLNTAQKPNLELKDSNKKYDFVVEDLKQGGWKITCTAWNKGEQEIRVFQGKREILASPVKINAGDRKSGSSYCNCICTFIRLVAIHFVAILLVAIFLLVIVFAMFKAGYIRLDPPAVKPI